MRHDQAIYSQTLSGFQQEDYVDTTLGLRHKRPEVYSLAFPYWSLHKK
jgi:hypothetical protein